MIKQKRLKELATLRPEGHKVLSLYLNLDPSELPTPRDRRSEFDSLFDSAGQGAREDGLSRGQREELKADLERLKKWFESEFDASGTRGVVVFAASGIGLFEVLHLARPIGSEVVIDDSPFIEPLTEITGGDGYCVLLVNRQAARILRGGADGMREVSSFVDDVHGWHGQGGWSQSRYQRGIVKEVKDHLKHTADELFALFKRGQVQRLIIGTQAEYRGEVEQSLHSYLRDRIAGWIDIGIRSSPSEVAEQAAQIIIEDEQQREGAWIDRLQSELGRNSRGVSGLEDTLAALNERRVEALLVRKGFRAPGFATANSDWLSNEAGSSPQGEPLEEREDVVESAIESALEQSAELVAVHHFSDRLGSLGSIAAVLRF